MTEQDNTTPSPPTQSTQNTITDMGSLLDRLLRADIVSQRIKDAWWSVFSDDLVLTNYSETEIRAFMNDVHVLEIHKIRKLHGHKYNIDEADDHLQVKMAARHRGGRSKGGFEREKQTEQKVTNVNEQRPDAVHSSGYINQVKRAFGGGQ